MAALTAARSTKRKISSESPMISGMAVPVKAATKCIQGGIAVLDTGVAAPGRTATGLVAIGIFEDTADNTSGATGAINARVRRGTFKFAAGGGADAIVQANVGAPCYIIDDQTVGLTDGNGTRSYAGAIAEIGPDGQPYVEIGAVIVNPPGLQFPVGTVSLGVDLASLINAQTIQSVLGFAGRIKSVSFVVAKPVTTGAKAATLTAQIGATPVTGGAIALTSANCTPQGAEVAGSAVTALNTFTAAQAVGAVVSGVTAFVEGQGTLIIHLG